MTGHEMGGTIAQAVGAFMNLPTYSFGSYGGEKLYNSEFMKNFDYEVVGNSTIAEIIVDFSQALLSFIGKDEIGIILDTLNLKVDEYELLGVIDEDTAYNLKVVCQFMQMAYNGYQAYQGVKNAVNAAEILAQYEFFSKIPAATAGIKGGPILYAVLERVVLTVLVPLLSASLITQGIYWLKDTMGWTPEEFTKSVANAISRSIAVDFQGIDQFKRHRSSIDTFIQQSIANKMIATFNMGKLPKQLGYDLLILGEKGARASNMDDINNALSNYKKILPKFHEDFLLEGLSYLYSITHSMLQNFLAVDNSMRDGVKYANNVFKNLRINSIPNHSISNLYAFGELNDMKTVIPDTVYNDAMQFATDPKNVAARYSLVNLIPFVVEGVDYNNILGQMDVVLNYENKYGLYDFGTGTGQLTESYIHDRALFMKYLYTDGMIHDYYQFTDLEKNIVKLSWYPTNLSTKTEMVLEAVNEMQKLNSKMRYITFGTIGDDTRDYGINNYFDWLDTKEKNRVYLMEGNDEASGGGGDDITLATKQSNICVAV